MLNEEVVDSLQKVNVNLVYYGDNVTISIQRDKTLNVIYQSAYDYFKPHGKIKLYHKNKELTPFLNTTISKYFLKLKNIDILVKDTAKVETNLDSKLNSNFNENNNLNSKNNKSSLPQNQRAMTYCWDCKKFPINLFCRDCCSFICKNCRMDIENTHYSHRTITLYPENLAKSANLYKNVLIEDLNEIQKNNKNGKKIKNSNETNIDIEKYKNHLFEKVNRLLNKIKQIKNYQNEINYYINNKNQCKEKINKAIKDVKNISNEFNNKNNEDNEDDEGNLNSQNNVGDLKDAFTKMNNIEKSTQKICKIGKSLEEWEDINSKLEIALKTVENKIYSVITEAMNYGTEKNHNEDIQQKEKESNLENNYNDYEKKDSKDTNNNINSNNNIDNIDNNANNSINNYNNNNINENKDIYDNNNMNDNNNINDNYNIKDNENNDNDKDSNNIINNDSHNEQIQNKGLEKEDMNKDINQPNIDNNNLNQDINIEKNKNNANDKENEEEEEYEYEYEEVEEEEEVPDVKN